MGQKLVSRIPQVLTLDFGLELDNKMKQFIEIIDYHHTIYNTHPFQ